MPVDTGRILSQYHLIEKIGVSAKALSGERTPG